MERIVWAVDDDEDIRYALQMMFRLLGYTLREFPEARSAARALMAETNPDLLVLDINMPEVNGLELLQFLRSRSAWNALPILILSSESDEEHVEAAIRMGADSYAFKPLTITELKMAVQTAFQRRLVQNKPAQL